MHKDRTNSNRKDFRWSSEHDSKGGPPRIWEASSMEKWKDELHMGQCFSLEEVKKKLTKLTGQTPCANTVKIYFEELVQDPDQPLIKKVLDPMLKMNLSVDRRTGTFGREDYKRNSDH